MWACCIACRAVYDSSTVNRCTACTPRRLKARLMLKVCESNKCGQWGTRGESTGCLLLAKPCDAIKHHLHRTPIKGCPWASADAPDASSGEPL
jgi:hypothetical protein